MNVFRYLIMCKWLSQNILNIKKNLIRADFEVDQGKFRFNEFYWIFIFSAAHGTCHYFTMFFLLLELSRGSFSITVGFKISFKALQIGNTRSKIVLFACMKFQQWTGTKNESQSWKFFTIQGCSLIMAHINSTYVIVYFSA